MGDSLGRCQIRLTLLQPIFRPLSLRNVTKHHLRRGSSLIDDRTCSHFGVCFPSIVTNKSVFVLLYISKIFTELFNSLFYRTSIIRVHKVEKLHSDDFIFWRSTQKGCAEAVREDNCALPMNQHCVWRSLDKQTVGLFALSKH